MATPIKNLDPWASAIVVNLAAEADRAVNGLLDGGEKPTAGVLDRAIRKPLPEGTIRRLLDAKALPEQQNTLNTALGQKLYSDNLIHLLLNAIARSKL